MLAKSSKPKNLNSIIRNLGRFKEVVIFCVAMGIGFSSFGQKALFTQYKFHRLNEAQGLSNNVINDILQDTLGQIWVGTEEGLFRYQGAGFQKFIKNKENPQCLHNNFIGSLYLDKYNDIWVTTDDGVSRYSYKTDAISRFLPDQISGRVTSMAIDAGGVKYFARHEGGIWKVSGDSVSMLRLFNPSSGIDFDQYGIYLLTIVRGKIWAEADGVGIICVDLETSEITHFTPQDIAGKEKLKCFRLYVDKEDRIWIGTDISVYQLSIDKNGRKIVDRSLESMLPQDDYLSIYKDNENQIWIGSRQNGMYSLRDRNEKGYQLARHFIPSMDDYSISHRTVSEIFQEENGFFWLGTHNGGINVFHPEGEAVRTVTQQLHHSPYSLAYENVWGICESSNGKIWVGIDGRGMSLLDPATGEVTNNVLKELEDKAVLAVYEDRKGRLWIGTYAHGIFLYDPVSKKVSSFIAQSVNSELLVNDIRCFYDHPNGQLYIGTNQGGLYSFDESSRRIVRIKGIPALDIRAITSSGNDHLYLGTFGEGVLKYGISEEALLDFQWPRNEEHGHDVVFNFYSDGQILWSATRHHGVVAFDLKREIFLDIPVLGEMEGRSISAIQADQQHNLWITTNTSILYFDRQLNKVKTFDARDGFQSGHFNFGSIFLSRNGFVAAGGIHGMNLFYPEELVQEQEEAPIVFNQFKIFNQTVTPVNSEVFPQNESIFLADRLSLHYSDNIFSVQFSLPGFTTHSKNEFVYKLEGYEPELQYAAESNVGTYRNVPPGNYTFKVKNLRNDVEKSLSIVIRPPVWKTWQAYLVYILLLVWVVWKLNRFSNSRIVLKQKLEFEQELREKEHAIMQEKLRFYTNFSHELKTPLTLIQGPVNDLIKMTKDAQKLQYLRLIRKNTNIILRFIRRMLEFRKIEMNKTVLNVGKHDLKILAQEEAENFGYHAKDKGIRFGFYCENEVEAWVDVEKIQIVMNNLLSNAFKFTPKGKTINFGVFQDDKYLYIEVKDEGIGIAPKELDNVFSPFFQASNSYGSGGTGIGLALSKSFVELHLGEIQVESQVGQGTKFLIKVPKDKSQLESKEYVRIIQVESTLHESFAGSLEIVDGGEKSFAANDRLIMVVDDNKDIAAYIRSLFEEDFNVMEAHDGLEAYDLATRHTPDLIISDMMMPGLDGFEFCQKIKENISTSHVPVIMLTAKDSKQDKISGYQVGADDYITKPFSSELLIARVNNLLKSREMLEIHYEANDLIDPESHQNSREAEFVLKAESIILDKLGQAEFGVTDICQELGMSQTSLYRKIKSLTGVSIQTFIRKIRIKRAAELLISEDLSVSEVAFSIDFSDLKYFRKCFKDQFGVTPSEYKNTHTHKKSALDSEKL